MMFGAQYDLTAMGLPFIDLIAQVDDAFLKRFGLVKREVSDLNPSQILALRAELSNYTIYPGGSPSNTCACMAALGGEAVFLGRVGDDANGVAFRKAFPSTGVTFPNQSYPHDRKLGTGFVLVLITSDGAATIVAAPSIGDHMTDRDIFPDLIAKSAILYFQAQLYLLFDSSRQAADLAVKAAKAAGREVAISLHGERMNGDQAKYFIETHLHKADILFGNRQEFGRLFRPFDDVAAVNDRLLMIVTDGANGAYILGRGENLHIPPHLLKASDNTVGAGDAFAAGFFFGYVRGLDLHSCGELGAEAASTILEISGARPVNSWKAMAEKYLTKNYKNRVLS